MTTSAAEQIVKLRTPTDIVDAVPHLVGFHPANSVVFVALRGKRRRLGVVARFDLPDPSHAEECAVGVVEYLRRDQATGAIIVFYPPCDGPAHPSVRALADRMADRLVAAKLGLADMLCVSEGRWWSLGCDGEGCCPAEGTPVERRLASPLATAMALEGRVTLASREELGKTLAPADGVLAAAMGSALPRARSGLTHEIAAGRRSEVATESIGLFYAAVQLRVCGEQPRPLDVEAAARLIAGLDDVLVRDEVITWFEGSWGDATRALMNELVRKAVPPFDPTPLTVFGWLSYLHGNGAIAGIAVDRVLAAGAANGMARLLDDALRAGVNPSTFKRGLNSLRRTPIPAENG